ncbi:hypothetical protein MSP8887_03845 [Marinomonas spartinae]|uniref:Uncharacterized protein n=1 Tax=Marinomonas spartinae TaxID=1792290 RepID=A0A1A8TMG7_9GAMM|nr:hypothetical protein MSP8886_03309 [Marinomonas spartinae]SBS39487.1 hypothetical protein MSP8887_03845 [Marinomonas spartinae]
MIRAKGLLVNTAIVIGGTVLNFLVFLEAYKRLAFPYINEEQRVDNAPYIFIYVLPSFLIVSIVFMILFKVMSTSRHKNC